MSAAQPVRPAQRIFAEMLRPSAMASSERPGPANLHTAIRTCRSCNCLAFRRDAFAHMEARNRRVKRSSAASAPWASQIRKTGISTNRRNRAVA